MPAVDWGFAITPEEFASWIITETPLYTVLDKPAGVVCHPSKRGPWSSLVGAAREYYSLPVIHMPFRLDRETSGVWVAGRDRDWSRALQRLVEQRQVSKSYLAVLEGHLSRPVTVTEPLARDPVSPVRVKMRAGDGQPAVTHFQPLRHGAGRTLVRCQTETGRLHQIRVHAAWLGHPVAADKIYGPDETLYLDFCASGWTPRLAQHLPAQHHALHCEQVECAELGAVWTAPPPGRLETLLIAP